MEEFTSAWTILEKLQLNNSVQSLPSFTPLLFLPMLIWLQEESVKPGENLSP